MNEEDENAMKQPAFKSTSLPPLVSAALSTRTDCTGTSSELLGFTASRLDGCTDVVRVECPSGKMHEKAAVKANNVTRLQLQRDLDEVPPFYERMDYSHFVPNSVACQTEWSWLAVQRLMKARLPQKSSSTYTKSKSDSKIAESTIISDANKVDFASSLVTDSAEEFRGTSESLKTEPYPSRADEFGVPFDDSADEELIQNEEDVEDEEDDDEDDEEEGEEEEEEEDLTLEHLLNGICQFCGKEKKPFPSLEDQETKTPDELYCCSAFREFISEKVTEMGQLKVKYRKRKNVRSKNTYIKSRGRKKRKPKRKSEIDEEAKTQEEDQVTEDGEPRSRSKSSLRDKTKDSDRSCVKYGREMMTINYQLSSRQCMQWTVVPAASATCQQHPKTVKIVEPIQHQGKLHFQFDAHPSLLCQTYENGAPFLVIFSDGSGNVFYPNGHIAVTIITLAQNDYTYIVQDTNSRLLGFYEPNGRTVTYHRNGTIWVSTDESGGLELDSEGNRRKKWSWNDRNHNHAPPLFSITCSISPEFTFSVSSQNEMTLLFEKSKRACRFNVGANPQVAHGKKTCHQIPDLFDANESYIKKMKLKINEVLRKTSVLLKLPSSPRLDGTLSPARTQKMRPSPVPQSLRNSSRLLNSSSR